MRNPIPSVNEAMDAILAIVVLLFLVYICNADMFWSIVEIAITPLRTAVGHSRQPEGKPYSA